MIWKKAITVGGKKMQFRDLQKQYNVLKEEIDREARQMEKEIESRRDLDDIKVSEKSKRYVQVHNIFLVQK